ncbi:hypothetical protein [Listeria cornellensis]|uniref:Menaquinone-specific isochorismate synthase n=1 Tax=Listeria cornellensis FSL F6-0969 TaxID=1265820 RepID=W7BUY8_9LIST|nr:hypothetical protein [Listeria cornellensis]EUJ29552.1 menaquinone-specific isochorismate synthase [Listeria cornellensis FSL F6-0969]
MGRQNIFLIRATSFFKGERFFWQNKERTLRLAGLGAMDQLRVEQGQDRFLALHTRKEQVLERTVTNSEETACGAVYFGGFSFDDQHDASPEWERFGEGFFLFTAFLGDGERGLLLFIGESVAIGGG